MNGNKIIVHALIKNEKGYLVTKRSKNETTFPEYWDIPGGLAEYGETPKEALIRETKEEVGLSIKLKEIIHEDSNLDKTKNLIFIRLVYLCKVKNNIKDITIQEEEHSEYKFIKSLSELKHEKIAPFLIKVFKKL